MLEPLSSPGVALMDEAIVGGLERSPYQIELYSENLEATLFPEETSQRQFREWYIRKYRDRKPDVIIAVGLEPLKFMVESHQKFFSGIPIVFCGSAEEMLDQLKLDSHFTGVWSVAQPEATLNAALLLQPDTKHVFVAGGVGAYDRHLEAIAREGFRKYEARFEFTYLTGLDMPTLLERLKHLPDHSIVYHTSMMQDVSGARFIDANQSVPMIASAANAPVFVVDDVDVGKGTVGGYVLSFAAEGRVAAAMAVRVLSGEKPQDIPIVKSDNVYMFDWRALQRWGLRESDVPHGSIMLYREPSVWESYKWYILGGLLLVLTESLLIFGLLWQSARRRKVQNELAVTYDRLRLALEAGKSAGWDWDVKTGRTRWFGDPQSMFGVHSDTHSGPVEDFWLRVHPDDRELVRKALTDARQSRNSHVTEFRVVRPDGTVRWITARGTTHYAPNGEAERTLGIAVDVTELRRAEEAVRESEERFRLVANTAPMMIWMSGTDKLCDYFNQNWLDFTGRPVAAELGNGWAEGVHAEDLSLCMDTYTRAFDRRGPFQKQYRLRRHDGEYRWVLDIGVPRFSPDGSFAGYIGSCIDITERKKAEEAFASLSGRLIEAQEEERRRIAREIHDDFSQQLAVLANDLEQLAENTPGDVGERLHELWNGVSELAADLHSLSHRLHSSTLETLGLVAGVSSFCEEFEYQQGIQVDFAHESIPHEISEDVALCLFRVVQEALRNIKRHSGAETAEVRLEGLHEGLHLSVSDKGRGFDSSKRSTRDGIGIRSMEERVRLLGGQFEIRSDPTMGTRIDVWLPLKAGMRAA